MIQLTNILKAICFQISRVRNTWCKLSYRTLHKIGYIMTRRPTAVVELVSKISLRSLSANHSPIGIDTPTNFPFCSAGPVLGTKFPNKIPTTIARNIHTARKRSSKPRFLKADCLLRTSSRGIPFSPCFSTSPDFSGTGPSTWSGRTWDMLIFLSQRTKELCQDENVVNEARQSYWA